MMLKENDTLKELDLWGCGRKLKRLEEVIKGVQVNTKLETLDLSINTIDNKRASCLGKNYITCCGIVCTYVYMKKLYIGMFRLVWNYGDINTSVFKYCTTVPRAFNTKLTNGKNANLYSLYNNAFYIYVAEHNTVFNNTVTCSK